MNSEKESFQKSIQNPISKFYVKKLVPEAILPVKATQGSAGYDICAL